MCSVSWEHPLQIKSAVVADEKVRQRGEEVVVELPDWDDGPAVAEQLGLVLVEYVLQTLRDGASPAEGAVELRLRLLAHLAFEMAATYAKDEQEVIRMSAVNMRHTDSMIGRLMKKEALLPKCSIVSVILNELSKCSIYNEIPIHTYIYTYIHTYINKCVFENTNIKVQHVTRVQGNILHRRTEIELHIYTLGVLIKASGEYREIYMADALSYRYCTRICRYNITQYFGC